MDTLLLDLRYTSRLVVRQPGFTALVVLTLALGIGVNTAIFSIVNAVILRPLPFPEPERLVQIKKDFSRVRINPFIGLPEFKAWEEHNQVFDQIAGYEDLNGNLSGEKEAERVGMTRVSSDFFPLLQVQPAVGRSFLPEETRPGGQPVVLLSDGLWKRHFGGEPGVIGKPITVDSQVYTIVGVLPENFRFPDRMNSRFDLCMPLASGEGRAKYGMSVLLRVIGRLKPGVTKERAGSELDAISSAALKSRGRGKAVVVRWQEEIVGDVKLRLLIFLGAVGLVLLIACANVANLLLSRAAAREKEIAIRSALGAGRMRVFRQLITESLFLALAGAAIGLIFAFWAKDLLHTLVAAEVFHVQTIGIDRWVLGFTILLAAATGVLFGITPALQALRVQLSESLKEGSRGSQGLQRHRLSNLLVVSEVAVALLLLIGAGLLLRSLVVLQGIDLGFQLDHMLSMTIDLTPAKYPKPHDQAAYFQQVVERVQDLPGVESVAVSASLPLRGFAMTSTIIVGGRSSKDGNEKELDVSFNVVSSNFFRTMYIPLLRGRFFTSFDAEGASSVAIVNEAFVRFFFPNEDPIGKQIKTGFQKDDWLAIVGVVGDVRQSGLERQAGPEVYRSYLQAGTQFMSLAVRTFGDPMKLAAAVRSQIMSVDKDQPAFSITTLEQALADSLMPRKVNMIVLSVFAALALVLAAVGIYGVVSYSVSRRTHEIGIRMALGADQRHVLKMIVGQSMVHSLLGVAVGLVAAAAMTRLISSLLYGVRPTDPITFAAVSLLLLMIAFVASYLPSRKATKVDPMVALRCE